jgi:N-methylhydantoinase A
VRLVFGADLRYFGQQNEVTVTFADDPRPGRDSAAIRAAFEAAYLAQYGFNPSHVPVEIVTWRLTARGPRVPFHVAANLPATAGAPRGERPVHLWRSGEHVPVYDRATLAAGQALRGPAIIEERETTLVIPPGWRATVDRFGCVVATPE